MNEEFPNLGYFGFSDLHSFKDYLGLVLHCAPDFPEEDWLKPEEQLNLDRAFVGLELGYQLIAEEGVDPQIVATCRVLSAEALKLFKAGQELEAARRLQQVDSMISPLPSR